MQALGINTIFDLSNYDMQKLIAVFGKTLATYFHNASLGIDDEPVQERGEATSISRISTLKQDSREPELHPGKNGSTMQRNPRHNRRRTGSHTRLLE